MKKKLAVLVLIIAVALTFSYRALPLATPLSAASRTGGVPIFPVHEPYGSGVGVMPGRVVWTHDPDSVEWNGDGYWWQPAHFDEAVLRKMVNRGIAALGAAADAQAGWDSLFRAHNVSRGKQGGYRRGQKIAIKTNINGAGAYADDTKGETHESYTNPVLLKALLFSLVTEAGIAPGDITVYDAGRVFPDYMRKMCGEGPLEGVRFLYRDLLGVNDAKADPAAPVVWSRKVSGAVNYLPACLRDRGGLFDKSCQPQGSCVRDNPLRQKPLWEYRQLQSNARSGSCRYSPLPDRQ